MNQKEKIVIELVIGFAGLLYQGYKFYKKHEKEIKEIVMPLIELCKDAANSKQQIVNNN